MGGSESGSPHPISDSTHILILEFSSNPLRESTIEGSVYSLESLDGH